MKICASCNQEKDDEKFGIVTGSKRRRNFCNECRNARATADYWEDREKYRLRFAAYAEKNREKIRAQQKRRYKRHRERIRKGVRENKKPVTQEQREKNRLRQIEWCKVNVKKKAEASKRHKLKNPQKHNARLHLMWAVKLGLVKRPNICEKCSMERKIEAHHTDYEKPLEVMWLCRICHFKEHGKLLDVDPRKEE